MSKMARIHDLRTGETRLIPAAEFAPGMIQVDVKDVGLAWVDAAQVNASSEYRHPPFDREVLDFIEEHIRKPLADIYPRTLAQ